MRGAFYFLILNFHKKNAQRAHPSATMTITASCVCAYQRGRDWIARDRAIKLWFLKIDPFRALGRLESVENLLLPPKTPHEILIVGVMVFPLFGDNNHPALVLSIRNASILTSTSSQIWILRFGSANITMRGSRPRRFSVRPLMKYQRFLKTLQFLIDFYHFWNICLGTHLAEHFFSILNPLHFHHDPFFPKNAFL